MDLRLLNLVSTNNHQRRNTSTSVWPTISLSLRYQNVLLLYQSVAQTEKQVPLLWRFGHYLIFCQTNLHYESSDDSCQTSTSNDTRSVTILRYSQIFIIFLSISSTKNISSIIHYLRNISSWSRHVNIENISSFMILITLLLPILHEIIPIIIIHENHTKKPSSIWYRRREKKLSWPHQR